MAGQLSAGAIVTFVFICLGLLIFFITLCCCWSRRNSSSGVRMVLGISSSFALVVTIPLAVMVHIVGNIYLSLKRRRFIVVVRLLSGLLCAVLGGFAAYNAAALMRSRPREDVLHWNRWAASCLISTIIGWIYVVFNIVVLYCVRQVWTWRPHGFPWWFLVTDALTALSIIAAMVIVPTEQALIPVTQCRAVADQSAMFRSAASALSMSPAHACRYLVTTYALEIAVIFICCLQLILCLPAAYSLFPIFPIRVLHRKFRKTNPARGQKDAAIPLSKVKLSLFPPSTAPSTAQADPLVRALGEAAVAASISSNLHYLDIVNLGLTCRGMHRAMFSTNSSWESSRIELLHLSSCINGSKQECWGCARQICEGCQMKQNVPIPAAEWHMLCCVAFCTRCAAAKTYPAILGHYVACPMEWVKKKSSGEMNFEVQLCRDCDARTAEEAVDRRDKREVRNMQKLVKVNGPRCHSCARDLTGHVPWWACCKCGMGCDWKGHFPDK